jgi:uncharacterized protein
MAIDSSGVQFASQETDISLKQCISVLSLLLDEDCTIPFVTRYRKEKTGGLDEVQIRDIKEAYEGYLEREKRREFILETIKKMEKLTPELEKQIKAASTLTILEDLYAPFKSKRKTKAMKAQEAGLGPLAEILRVTTNSLTEIEKEAGDKYLNIEHKITTFQEALAGALDIIIETIAHDTEIKEQLREDFWKEAKLVSSKRLKAEEEKEYLKFKDYFEFSEPISQLKDEKNSHRFLAMRRGMSLKILKIEVCYDEETAISFIAKKYLPDHSGVKETLEKAIGKSYRLFIHTSLDVEIKTELKKVSDQSAIDVFGKNLRDLLLQPYLGAKCVLGVDPGVRTGCKLAVVDDTGKYIIDTVIYPFQSKSQKDKAEKILLALTEKFNIFHMAIGNGTYGRETLQFIEGILKNASLKKVKATLISESGASIYSTSDIARKEFPDLDPTVRGSISIARRFQDPLAELVKIDPKSIGVGQYQHDVNQTKLKKSLEEVVESCVNYVGVDINTASAPLLSFISGIGPALAKNVVSAREKKGGFKKRAELLEVSRFNDKIYQQSAGFLRIYKEENPLDSTFIHPENYPKIESWATQNNVKLHQLVEDKDLIKKLESDKSFSDTVGEFTHKDIISSLRAPSQDPRSEFKSIEFRDDIRSIKDLKVGEWYTGVINNITKFGAFVDIGIKESGLLHISQISDTFVKDPLSILKVGQEVKAQVLEIDLERKRISLSCKKGSKALYQQKPQKEKSQPKKSKSPFSALKNFKV